MSVLENIELLSFISLLTGFVNYSEASLVLTQSVKHSFPGGSSFSKTSSHNHIAN